MHSADQLAELYQVREVALAPDQLSIQLGLQRFDYLNAADFPERATTSFGSLPRRPSTTIDCASETAS